MGALYVSVFGFFFFFKGEDGIRGDLVTGVQTCALPIWGGDFHARATVPDADGLLTPGGFARVRVQVAPPALALLVPDASVLPDQSDHIVLTIGPNNVVTPKQVQIGDLRDGLRVIRSGLHPSDRVIVDGIPMARPGATVAPHAQSIQTTAN